LGQYSREVTSTNYIEKIVDYLSKQVEASRDKIKMASEFSVITQSVVSVNISSSLNSFGSERRFAKDITIADLKASILSK